MDLNKMVLASLGKMEASGKVEELIEKRLENTLGLIIDDLLGWSSDFGKSLKLAIKERLGINFEELQIETYNAVLLAAIQKELDSALHIQGVEKMKRQILDIVTKADEEYKLSFFIKKMKAEYADKGHEEISLHISPSDVLTFVYFDPEPDVLMYKCRFKLTINKDGSLSSVEIKGTNFDEKVIFGGLHGLERELFRAYAHGSKIVLDVKDVDWSYESEYED